MLEFSKQAIGWAYSFSPLLSVIAVTSAVALGEKNRLAISPNSKPNDTPSRTVIPDTDNLRRRLSVRLAVFR
jgi:hypothetical protein